MFDHENKDHKKEIHIFNLLMEPQFKMKELLTNLL